MPNYTPKSDEELAREGLLSDGIYDFEINDAEDKLSKKNNPMAVFKLHIFDSNGNARSLTDYIAFGNSFGERKWRHAAVACGLLDVYDSGALTAFEFKGKCGKVQIKIQDGSVDYPLPKNVIVDYLKPDGSEVKKPTFKLDPSVEEDACPF